MLLPLHSLPINTTESRTYDNRSRFRVCRGTDLRWSTTRMDQQSAKKCRGGFLDWEHAIPQPFLPSPAPTRIRETEEEITWRSYTKIPPLSSKCSSAEPRCCSIFSLLLCPNLTRWLRLLVIALDFQSDFTPASSLLPYWIRGASFLVPVWVAVESTGSCSCGLAPLHRCAKSNDIITSFVQQTIERRQCSPGVILVHVTTFANMSENTHRQTFLRQFTHTFEKDWLTVDKGHYYSLIGVTANMGR